MNYETGFQIGSGGMGEVFKAWDPELQRHVALKYLHHDDPIMVERLLREARAQARVDHPSVCKVFEVGMDDGRPFIAMEYVEGKPLNVAVEGLSIEQKVLLIKQVTDAVQAAHAAGLIHRDLKPANILVTDHEGELHPFVLDFGIARIEELRGLTLTGQVVGTPGYLSPEQARGESEKLDRRTDVFSLGVILYELMGGTGPFEADSRVEMLIKLLEEDPLPLRRLAPHIPRDLDTIVMRCLEKDPNRRYPSALTLAEDLQRFLDGEPIHARRTGIVTRVRLKARRNPKTAAAAAIALATVIGVSGIAVHERRASNRRAAIARDLGREVESIEGLLEKAYLLPLHDIRPTQQEVRRRIRGIDERILSFDPASRALAHAAIGRAYLALGQVEEAHDRLQQAWDLGEHSADVASDLGIALAEMYRAAREDSAGIRNPRAHQAALDRAIDQFRNPARRFLELSDGGDQPPEYLAATLAAFSDDREKALRLLDGLKTRAPFFYRGDLLRGAIERGIFEEASRTGGGEIGDRAFSAAVTAFENAARIGESDPRPYTQLCGLWVGALRNQFWERGGDLLPARDAAIQACNDALAADPDSAAAHVEAGRAWRYWASSMGNSGQDFAAPLTSAQNHARAAIESDPSNAAARVLLGVTHRIAAAAILRSGGDPREELLGAVDAYREAIRLRPGDSGARMSLANALLGLGEAARNRGDDPDEFFKEAAETAGEAIELDSENVGAHVNLGIAHAQLGISARNGEMTAEPHFTRAIAALERAIELNPEFLTAHFNLGETLLEAAIDRSLRGEDPELLLERSLEMLGNAADGYPNWAAPHYLMAEATARTAAHRGPNGEETSAFLDQARSSIMKARAIDPTDATGLARSSLVFLVEARQRLDRGLDPSPQVDEGLRLLDDALDANPNEPLAWTRRAEFLLVRARYELQEKGDAEHDIDAAGEALDRVQSLRPEGVTDREARLALEELRDAARRE